MFPRFVSGANGAGCRSPGQSRSMRVCGSVYEVRGTSTWGNSQEAVATCARERMQIYGSAIHQGTSKI